jgi:hypothetical protein
VWSSLLNDTPLTIAFALDQEIFPEGLDFT